MVNLQVPGWITNPLFYPAPMLSHPVDLLASAPIYLQDKDNLSNITTSSFKLSNINTYGNSSRTPHV